MSSSNFFHGQSTGYARQVVREERIEDGFIGKLQSLKYEYRRDIRDRAALERNFREKFEALNRVNLSDGEFARLLEDIVTPDVFTAARTLRERNSLPRDDGTPLTFFRRDDFSACIHGLEDSELFARALNLLSHGKYDIYQPMEMVDDNKKLFRQILDAFLGRYEFSLPEIFLACG